MAARPSALLILLAAVSSLGASYRTQNFVVEAPTPAIAEQVGQYAEHYRREKAVQWLGQEMPAWPEPCPLRVTLTMNGSGGATSFAFDRGRILGQNMNIEGSLDRILASVLPHEITHTVFAQYFRQPVPRWADEGGSVLSEDELERQRHDSLVRTILNTPGRAIPLRRLFVMREYPNDVMVLYAEGYSVTNFLVGQSNRQTYLAFINHGMRNGWDDAARKFYNYNRVEDLEQAWLQNLRDTKRQPASTMVATTRGDALTDPASRVVERTTVPPAQPLAQEPQAIVRGSAPNDINDRYNSHPFAATGRPQYLPDYRSPNVSSSPTTWPSSPSTVRLGAPEIDAPSSPGVQLGQPIVLPVPGR